MQTDNKVELEISLGLDWVEVGSIGYSPKQDEKTGRSYYNLTVKRREPAKSSPSPGLTDTITFSLYTQNKKEVAQLVQRLTAVSRECRSQKG